MRLYVTMFEALAYPAPAQFVPHPIAVLGELDADGTFRTMVGPFELNKIRLHAVNVVGVGDAKLGYYKDDEPVLLPFTGTLDGDPVYAIATTPDGTPWLVSSHADWRLAVTLATPEEVRAEAPR